MDRGHREVNSSWAHWGISINGLLTQSVSETTSILIIKKQTTADLQSGGELVEVPVEYMNVIHVVVCVDRLI